MAERNAIADVLAAYGADPAVLEEYDCLPLRVRLVRDVLKIRTPSGSRMLKKVYMSDQRLDYVYRCTEYIAAGGLANVPRFIRNRYGDPYVEHQSGLYYMTSWLSGREPDLRKPSELFATARLLARWHQSAAAFEADDGWHPDHPTMASRLTAAQTDLREAVTQARSGRPDDPFDRLLLACADELGERTDTAIRELTQVDLQAMETEAQQRRWLCHGGFVRHNLLFDGETYFVLNYDAVYRGPPLAELALFLHRYLPAFEWDATILARTVDAYMSIWGRSSGDVERISALLAAPLRSLQAVSWRLRKAKDWDDEDYVDYLEASLELEEARERARRDLVRGQDLRSGPDRASAMPAVGGPSALQPVHADVAVEMGAEEGTVALEDGPDGVMSVHVDHQAGTGLSRRARKPRKGRVHGTGMDEPAGPKIWSAPRPPQSD